MLKLRLEGQNWSQELYSSKESGHASHSHNPLPGSCDKGPTLKDMSVAKGLVLLLVAVELVLVHTPNN